MEHREHFRVGLAVGTTFSATDNCFVVDSPQQLYNCESQNPYQTGPLQRLAPAAVGSAGAAMFQSLPAANYGANYTVSSAAIAPSLGRPLAGTTNVTIDLLPQGGNYLDERIAQVDARLTKIIRVRSAEAAGQSRRLQHVQRSTVLQVNSTYGPNWLMPTQILMGGCSSSACRWISRAGRAGRQVGHEESP